MMDLGQLQLLAQLIDSIDLAVDKLGKAYEKKDSEKFYNAKKTTLEFQREISKQIK
jgi:hypothetical protein